VLAVDAIRSVNGAGQVEAEIQYDREASHCGAELQRITEAPIAPW
jgi:hypothetical protein